MIETAEPHPVPSRPVIAPAPGLQPLRPRLPSQSPASRRTASLGWDVTSVLKAPLTTLLPQYYAGLDTVDHAYFRALTPLIILPPDRPTCCFLEPPRGGRRGDVITVLVSRCMVISVCIIKFVMIPHDIMAQCAHRVLQPLISGSTNFESSYICQQ
jgi:hypothetical protein